LDLNIARKARGSKHKTTILSSSYRHKKPPTNTRIGDSGALALPTKPPTNARIGDSWALALLAIGAVKGSAGQENRGRGRGELKGVLTAGGERGNQPVSAASLCGGRLGRRTGIGVLVDLWGHRRTPLMRLIDTKLLVMSDCCGLAPVRRIVQSSGRT
jgi:hypothetical protein